jgi:hypothetical protein
MNHIEYEKELTEGSIRIHGRHQAMANKLIDDIDSYYIKDDFAEVFINLYNEREGVDLVSLMGVME